jgi:murein DD-endopeptidase MepM/ murein hydrolase activator NlpD
MAASAHPTATPVEITTVIVRPGESVEAAAGRAGARAEDARVAGGLIDAAMVERGVESGTPLRIALSPGGGARLMAVSLRGADGSTVAVTRDYDGRLHLTPAQAEGRSVTLADAEFEASLGEAQARAAPTTVLGLPIPGARISSDYGLRSHPLLGYSRMHQGIDYAAPAGTPVLAAATGLVAQAQPLGGYGNWLRISHADGWDTGYAHLASYAAGIRAGALVRQGQIVGFVGATGLTTGPHLHYEVWLHGVRVNPARAPFAPAEGGRDGNTRFASFNASTAGLRFARL